ncbi:uncharacterized protein LOC126148402 [Schistocerca cancellata]|uniref:uncharacterized protein LOC126148402 n=1 Tax=Schistocerca cancellata TaxID=274614 RepID=UPI0021196AF4|nr:uncharacterized protein LOC126148402 [Schistocerca cancellata]
MARAKGFNRDAVDKFFDLLESVFKEHKFSPDQIYNVNETGIMTVPNKPSKVLALRGQKQVDVFSSADRGILVTTETCINAAGNFMPVMFVFPRKRENSLLMDDAPGSFAVYHESGWINKDSFLIWFKKFVEFSNPMREKPVLLIIDGHNSHVKSLEMMINLAQEKHVILLCFPPRTTHRLQPIDVTFMDPLSAFYEQEVRKWLVNHPGHVVTIYQVGKLFNAAFSRAACVETALKGFKKSQECAHLTGIFSQTIFLHHLRPQRGL